MASRLASIQGHRGAVRLLSNLIERQRLPPSVIMSGRAGIGRRSLIRAIAAAVVCHDPIDGDACGRCASCGALASGAHPDVVELPGERDAADLKVDQVRDEVVGPAVESPLMGSKRVFLIPDAERLKGPSANALLKILEEPPAGVRFLLTVAHPEALLETIRSRAQVLRLQPLSTPEVAAVLKAGGVAPAVADQRAAQGGGSHRGLWGDSDEAPPLDDLRRLTLDGFDARVVAAIMERLPSRAETVPSGATVAGEQRRLLRLWLEALLQDLRGRLRSEDAERVSKRIHHVLALRGDLSRYIQPRLIIEALGLPAA